MLCGQHPGLCPHDVANFVMAMPFIGLIIWWVKGCCSKCCKIFHKHNTTESHEVLQHGQEQADRPAVQ